jgi:hypothetical protein
MKKSDDRFPLQVSPEFKKRLDELQKKIMMSKGEKKSLRQLTTDIARSPFFKEMEDKIIRGDDIQIGINLKFDKRIFK